MTIPDDNYITNLKFKWNIFGVPFNQNIEKTDLIVNWNGIDYNWSEAVSNGIVIEYVFGWNRISPQSYYFSDLFEPQLGYWIYVYYDCILKINGGK